MAGLTHLLDNSVHAHLDHEAVSQRFFELQVPRRIARGAMFDLEALFSARRPRDVHKALLDAMPLVPTHQADFDRAVEVMLALADAGRHRSVKTPDLIVAAVAERAGLIVLHYDRDFDAIAAVTGQAVEAVVPMGSL
ncbi:MAG: PIN domain-containing protein [Candidatus Dormiibacterota bacterium]